MPDHWHGLIELGADEDLSVLVGHIKSRSALVLRRRCGWRPGVWQRGFHDRALRRQDDLIDMARYIVMNPIRAGLVRRVRDYRWWDAFWRDS